MPRNFLPPASYFLVCTPTIRSLRAVLHMPSTRTAAHNGSEAFIVYL